MTSPAIGIPMNPQRRSLRTLPCSYFALMKIVVLTWLCWLGMSGNLVLAQNVLLNGDLSKGSGQAPVGWKTAGWDNSINATAYIWHHSVGETPAIEVSNTKPNDSYWFQKIHL